LSAADFFFSQAASSASSDGCGPGAGAFCVVLICPPVSQFCARRKAWAVAWAGSTARRYLWIGPAAPAAQGFGFSARQILLSSLPEPAFPVTFHLLNRRFRIRRFLSNHFWLHNRYASISNSAMQLLAMHHGKSQRLKNVHSMSESSKFIPLTDNSIDMLVCLGSLQPKICIMCFR
jgi:hypothetical protein